MPPKWRALLLLACFLVMAALLLWRLLDLAIWHKDFLQHEGDARHLRVVQIPAHRGTVSDRHGEPLAISSPVDSVWAHPGYLLGSGESLLPLAELLGRDPVELRSRLEARRGREFVYLRRHIMPQVGEQVMALGLPGVSLQREYRRFYPAGEVMAHVLGFTNIDDRGQEGLELTFDEWLRGSAGAKRVVKDRLGRSVRDVESLREPRPGRELHLSLDRRLQFLAYRELKSAVQEHRAKSGSLVLLDVVTGEVLAMVNQPAFNPNNRRGIRISDMRNRAVTDALEPGSIIKPLTAVAALEAGKARPESMLDTRPGVMRVGGHTVRDIRNYGEIDVTTMIQKSSTVGAAKLALAMEPETLWGTLARLGYGTSTGIGFPGESGGRLAPVPPRSAIERATLSYGYGMAATPLQIARSYAAVANSGVLPDLSFVRVDEAGPGQQVIDPAVAAAVLAMMETVTGPGGTAQRARVPGYRVAGKTGTAKKSVAGGYADRYVALFAGVAPVSRPRFALVVVLDEPGGEFFYGGQVAAPVFAKVMAGTLRLLNVPPDDLPALQAWAAPAGGVQ